MRFDERKILVTGGNGMVGTALRKMIPMATFVGRDVCDFESDSEVMDLFSLLRPDAVIHLAAKVGGIAAQMRMPADFYHQNMLINNNVLSAAWFYQTKKVVSMLSTCIYPDKAVYPLTEDQLHNGPPHSSNFGYAYAKRMLDVASRAYRQQSGCNFVTVVPNNIFGINDSFDLENSHVIPGLIRKMFEAKIRGEKTVTLWGDGSPLREFTSSDDIAATLLFVLDNYDGEDPLNIGCTEEHSISSVANLVAEFVGFDGRIVWDTSKPNGQLRKPSSNEKFRKLGWNVNNYCQFETSLRDVCDWFVRNYPTKTRGV